MPDYFESKVVLITGGAGGIGTQLVSQLLQRNAKVVVLDINLEALDPRDDLLSICLDITDKDSLNNAVTQTISQFGKLDILINNAGITHLCKFTDLDVEDFDKSMAVNFTAAVNLTRFCLAHLIKTQGQIVAISSVAGFAPLYGRTAYSASKHAMQGFFASLATELKDDKVAVTIISPSFINSRPEISASGSTALLSPGAMKKSTLGEPIDPVSAAEQILTAIQKRQACLYLGRVAVIAKWLFALMPGLYIKLMIKTAKKELN